MEQFINYVVTNDDVNLAKEVARFLMEEDQDEHNDALQKAINAFEIKNGAFNAENVTIILSLIRDCISIHSVIN